MQHPVAVKIAEPDFDVKLYVATVTSNITHDIANYIVT